MTATSTLVVALTGACALVAAAMFEAPEDGRACGEATEEATAPAPPAAPHIHAGAAGACTWTPNDTAK